MTVRYVDAVKGNNSFDGLTPETAKATYTAAYNASSDGDTVSLAKDQFHAPFTYYYPVIQKNNFKLTAHGTGSKAILDSLYYENKGTGGWFYEGSGVWSKAIGNTANSPRAMRVFTGSYNNGVLRSQRDPGTGRRRAVTSTADNVASIKANLNANDIWWPGASGTGYKLFMYTGSATQNPPEFYNGIAVLIYDGTSIGVGNNIFIRNCSNVIVEDIEAWGGIQSSFLATSGTSDANPLRNVKIRRCIAKYVYSGGFVIGPLSQDNALPRVEISNVVIEDCVGNTGTSPEEQEPTTAYNILSGATDMFQIIDGPKNCRIVRCVSINSFHVGFVLGATTFNSLKTDNCVIEDCYMYAAPWMTYARGMNTYGCTDNNFIRRCIFDGQSIQSQFSGAPLVTGNTWFNNRLSVRKPDDSGWLGISALVVRRNFPNAGNDRDVYFQPENIRILGNMVIDPVGVLITMETFAANSYGIAEPTFKDNTVTIVNNILFDRVSTYTESIRVYDRVTTVGKQRIEYNSFYRPNSTVKYARYSASGQLVLSNLNSASDCKNNILSDPQVDITDPTNPVLAKTSPCRRAGKWVAHVRDARGRPYMVPPTIGPVECTAQTLRVD